MNGAWSGFDIPGGAWSAAALMIGLALVTLVLVRLAVRVDGSVRANAAAPTAKSSLCCARV